VGASLLKPRDSATDAAGDTTQFRAPAVTNSVIASFFAGVDDDIAHRGSGQRGVPGGPQVGSRASPTGSGS
jgi:hypothetical protein